MGGHVFATLAAEAQGYGNLMLSPAQQASFVAEAPELYLPVAGGWGRMGITHLRLTAAALHTAWKARIEKKSQARKPRESKCFY